MAPVDHVVADGVIPMHVTPNGGVGVVLEKHVVKTVPVNGAVGIVHPVFCGEQMKRWAKRIGQKFQAERIVFCESRHVEMRKSGKRCGGSSGLEKPAARGMHYRLPGKVATI